MKLPSYKNVFLKGQGKCMQHLIQHFGWMNVG